MLRDFAKIRLSITFSMNADFSIFIAVEDSSYAKDISSEIALKKSTVDSDDEFKSLVTF